MLRFFGFPILATKHLIWLYSMTYQILVLVPLRNVHLIRCSKDEELQIKMMIGININEMVQMNEHKWNSCECQKEIETEWSMSFSHNIDDDKQAVYISLYTFA